MYDFVHLDWYPRPIYRRESFFSSFGYIFLYFVTQHEAIFMYACCQSNRLRLSNLVTVHREHLLWH